MVGIEVPHSCEIKQLKEQMKNYFVFPPTGAQPQFFYQPEFSRLIFEDETIESAQIQNGDIIYWI